MIDVGMNEVGITRALVDTGSCSTIIDHRLVTAMNLPFTAAVGSEWGTFQGTGGEP